MFAVKFSYKNNIEKILKTINNIQDYISNLHNNNLKILKSKDNYEIIAGNKNIYDDNNIEVELTFKKTIIINKDLLEDKVELDKKITEIKQFCEKSIEIETHEYIPIIYRKS
jgi:hypothetical protein